jgi:hypothetical protein
MMLTEKGQAKITDFGRILFSRGKARIDLPRRANL